jgi:hypothetical protein
MSLSVSAHNSIRSQRNWSGRLAATSGTVLTAAGSSHTLGTKVELIASTSFDTHLVRVRVHNSFISNTQTDQLVNIYVGASTAEVLLIPNLLAGWANSLGGGGTPIRIYEFPLFIPAGTRLSADNQALIASDTVAVMIECFGGGQPRGWVGRGVECIGAVTASSQGTSVTSGGASDGTFTDIGTTAKEWRFVQPMLQGNLTDTAIQNASIAADIGVGGALLHELAEFIFTTEATENTRNADTGRYTRIPSGTALQLRAQSHTTAETHDWCIYGVY